VCGPTAVVEVSGERVLAPYTVEPEQLGLTRWRPSELEGGDAHENAALTRAVLRGEKGAPRDIVLLNAAGALYVGGAAPSLAAGLDLARDSLDSGRAERALDSLAELSRRLSADSTGRDARAPGPASMS
jgi:anthranilate phosphoribosyltransferase